MGAANFEPVAASEVQHWADTADVVIVGLGAAGACAAIEARKAGADVFVIERASGGGGTTSLAAGHLYLGGGTPVQRAVGVEDSVDAMFTYLVANTPEPDEDKIRLYCKHSVAHFEWLEAQGVPFQRSYYRGKHVVQPTAECLIESGNEKVWPFRMLAKPAVRGHKVAREGEAGGALLMEKLLARAQALGSRVVFDAGATNLIVDGDGRIAGVRYKRLGQYADVKARRAVILAAGGFAMNEAMLRAHCPTLADPRIHKLGNPHDDGSGIQLGLSAGGQALHLEGCLVTSPIYPDESLLKGILVNARGERFVAEDSYHARTTASMLQQADGRVYLIVDAACHGRPQMMGQQLIDAWETVEEMERALELPESSLQKTLRDYNAQAAAGADPAFHKHPHWLQALDQPPYGAFECSLGKAGYVGFTLGGLRVSIDGEVLDAQDRAVAGLFAAGGCASNIAQDGSGYSSGTCIGEATFFGRRAGTAAARTRKELPLLAPGRKPA
ncbi:MAG: FAD-binding protein [Nevskia sp.]|nr:FAD-binding protein [Nevskia sp.]